jgi:hypothetical protein
MTGPLSHLEKILALLGPGLSLEIDRLGFSQFFGGEIGQESAEAAAKIFAESQQCSFISSKNSGRFIRAYYAKHS